MKKLVVAFYLFSFTIVAFGQMEWEIRSPYPTTNNLKGDFFLTDQTGWVVGYNGTILHTTDGGVHWVTQHSNNTESIWNIFFIDENEGWAVGWSSIYHTTNAGNSWEKQAKPNYLGDMTDVCFVNPDTGWIVGTYNIVFNTTDGGDHWNRISSNINQNNGFYSVAFVNRLHGCAVGGSILSGDVGYIKVTDDGGLTWTETTPEKNSRYNKIVFLDDNIGWVCGENGELLKTTDGGYRWTHYDIGYDEFKDIHFFNQERGVVLSHSSVRITNDGGETWSDPINLNEFNSLQAFTSGADNHLVAVGYDGLIAKSVDGGYTWEKVSRGTTQDIKQIGFFNESEGLAITNYSTATGGLLHTLDRGESWVYDSVNGNGPYYKMQVLGQATCFLLNTSGQLVKSVDAAATWANSDVPAASSRYTDMQFVNNQAGYLCGDSGVLVKTTDGGISWNQINFSEGYDFSNLFFLDENRGWIVDYDGKQILKTTDGGNQWQSTNLEESGVVYQPLDIFFLNENEGYASTKEGVLFKSTDGGSSWQKSYTFDEEAYSGIVFFVSEQEGWYLSPKTAWHTTDGGNTWGNGSYFDVYLNDLYFINEKQGWLAGNTGLVAWYSFVGVDEINESSEALTFSPNPAKDNVAIALIDKSEKIVALEVWNMMGQKVIERKGLNNAGFYQLDVSSLKSGTYIIKVHTPEGECAGKLVIQ